MSLHLTPPEIAPSNQVRLAAAHSKRTLLVQLQPTTAQSGFVLLLPLNLNLLIDVLSQLANTHLTVIGRSSLPIELRRLLPW
jgi:hypothetical protein